MDSSIFLSLCSLKPSVYLTLHISKFTKYLPNKIVQIYKSSSKSNNLNVIALCSALVNFLLLSVTLKGLYRLPRPLPPPPSLLLTWSFLLVRHSGSKSNKWNIYSTRVNIYIIRLDRRVIKYSLKCLCDDGG